MKKNVSKNNLSTFKTLITIILLISIVSTVFIFSSCQKDNSDKGTPLYTQSQTFGEGNKTFSITVCDYEGKEVIFNISTDKEFVGEALLEHNLIEGENGPYGMYIKAVNGIRADYDIDGKYWAFYIDGEYATTGVDTTAISESSIYLIKVE